MDTEEVEIKSELCDSQYSYHDVSVNVLQPLQLGCSTVITITSRPLDNTPVEDKQSPTLDSPFPVHDILSLHNSVPFDGEIKREESWNYDEAVDGELSLPGTIERLKEEEHVRESLNVSHDDALSRNTNKRQSNVHNIYKKYFPAKLRCEVCDDQSFDSADKLDRHMHLHSIWGDKIFKCKHCEERYANKGDLKSHIKVHTKHLTCDTKELTCPACNRVFAGKKSLSVHASRFCKKILLTCEVCHEGGFPSAKKLKKHMRTHRIMVQKVFKCSKCPKQFANRVLLLAHRKSHKRILHSCTVCEKTFTMNRVCKSHISRCLDRLFDEVPGTCSHSSTATVTCEVCKATFRDAYYLKVHMRTHTGVMPFKCEYCEKSFTRLDSWKIHERSHTGERPYQCSICGDSFTSSNVLRVHLRSHNNHDFSCEKCNLSFKSPSHLRNHMQSHSTNASVLSHTDERPHQCSICGDAFTSLNVLRVHLRSHNNNHFSCEKCNLSFKSQSHYRNHMRSHSIDASVCSGSRNISRDRRAAEGTVFVQCSVCDQQFRDRAYLKIHMRKHTGELPYQCEICDKRFIRSQALHDHRLSHTALKPYVCEQCGQGFRKATVLRTHLKSHVSPDEYKYVCLICDERFAAPGQLEQHLKKIHCETEIDDNHRLHKCRKCPKVLASLNELRLHRQSHGVECQVCNKVLSCKTALSLHVRIHRGEKPYVCSFCTKAFTIRSGLSRHMMTHTGEKPFKCSVCTKAFITSFELKVHSQKVHSQNKHITEDGSSRASPARQKQFLCEFCGLQSLRYQTLKAHLLSHFEIAFCCKFCNESFSSGRAMTKHAQRVHDVPKKEWQKPGFFALKNKMGHLPTHKTVATEANTRQSDVSVTNNACKITALNEFVCTSVVAKARGHGRHMCNLCRKPCGTRLKLNFHLKSHKLKNRFKCRYCSMRFASQSKTKLHVSRWHRRRSLSCAHCQKEFSLVAVLELHLKSHLDQSTQNGHSVNGACSMSNGLSRRLSGEKPYICPHCYRGCASKYHLTSHLAAHERALDGSLNCCVICDKRLSSAHSFENHMRRHLRDMPYMCQYCAKQFCTSSALAYHMKTAHNDYSRLTPCGEYSKLLALKEHVRGGDEACDDSFSCECCHRDFRRYYELKRHLSAQLRRQANALVENRPVATHRCDTCDVTFTSSETLSFHGRQRHCQTTCGANESKPSTLTELRLFRQSSGEHCCSVCANTYGSVSSLNAHVMSAHTGGNQFRCDYCREDFIDAEQLGLHIPFCTKSYSCHFCSKVFRHLYKLKYHLFFSHMHGNASH